VKSLKEQYIELLSDGKPHAVTEFRHISRPSGYEAVRYQLHLVRKEVNIMSILFDGKVFYQILTEDIANLS